MGMGYSPKEIEYAEKFLSFMKEMGVDYEYDKDWLLKERDVWEVKYHPDKSTLRLSYEYEY
jgi:hypothetical protein